MPPHDIPHVEPHVPEAEVGGLAAADISGASLSGEHRYRHMLIDLDDTIYQNHEMPQQCLANIQAYMEHKLGIPTDDVPSTCYKYYLEHGTTLAGLVAHGHDIDYDAWHEDVHHTLPYSEKLRPAPDLKELLNSIPLPKWVFTNADKKHTDICLKLMGLSDCFEGIICFESVMKTAESQGLMAQCGTKPVICKPNPLAFTIALEAAGAEASSTIFLDDSVRNVTAARDMGIQAVLVKPGEGHWDGPTIPSLGSLPKLMPEIWPAEPMLTTAL